MLVFLSNINKDVVVKGEESLFFWLILIKMPEMALTNTDLCDKIRPFQRYFRDIRGKNTL